MKIWAGFIAALSLALSLVACGEDSVTDSRTDNKSETGNVSVQADSIDDLPNCSKNREGEIAEVLGERKAYICDNGRWEFDHDILDSVKTEDDLLACSSKNDGDSVWIVKESAVYVCSDRKWEKRETSGSEKKDGEPTAKSSSSVSGENSDGKSSGETASSSDGKTDGVSSSGEKIEGESSDSNSPESSSGASPKSSNARIDVETTGTVKDARDGKTYRTVRIGDQVWFAENLNYDDGYGLCPMREEENCAKYGRLYKFESGVESSITSVCPEGWHIPDSLEFVELISYVSRHNGGEPVGVSLKATTDWYVVGDTVFIPGDGEIALGSIDSTRVAATLGTDRFGFSALPAGSCWDNGGCYVGDDTRFFFMKPSYYGGGYKLAFDKDEFFYDEDAMYGHISVRCVQNNDISIDRIPSSVAVDSIVWMAEDLTSEGRSEFSMHEAMTLCPEGWRLPSDYDFSKAVKKAGGLFPNERLEYFTRQNAVSLDCRTGTCSLVMSFESTRKHVRCVSETALEAVSGCTCSASNMDSDNTVTWTVSGCKEGDYKISGYSWDFGDEDSDVTTSGAEAYKKFSTFESVTPLVTISSDVEMDGKSYSTVQTLACPTVRAGVSETTIAFSSKVKVKLKADQKYTAMLAGKCDEDTPKATVSCTYDDEGGESKQATILIGAYEFTGSSPIGGAANTLCNGRTFNVKASDDMECYISY